MSWTVCAFTGKHGFVTEEEALRQLRKAQTEARRQRRAGRKGIRRQERRVYNDCPCGRWHLTSMREDEVLSRHSANKGGSSMSTFSGKQGRGAMRERRKQKREQAEVRQAYPGARSAANLAVELGVPLSVIVAEADQREAWTPDERVNAATVSALRGLYGGAA